MLFKVFSAIVLLVTAAPAVAGWTTAVPHKTLPQSVSLPAQVISPSTQAPHKPQIDPMSFVCALNGPGIEPKTFLPLIGVTEPRGVSPDWIAHLCAAIKAS